MQAQESVTPTSSAATSSSSAAACTTCGQASPNNPQGGSVHPYVYAIGGIEPRFPRLSVEKEFAQAAARLDTKGLTDHQVRHRVLSQRENRYLARQMCWVLNIEGLDTYLLVPRDPADLDLLIDSVRETPTMTDLDVIIGTRGPTPPPDYCNGLSVPLVLVDQLYSFDEVALINALPIPAGSSDGAFRQACAELLHRVLRLTDNDGTTDAHRAVNYLAMRYPGIYGRIAEAFAHNCSLAAVNVIPARMGSVRNVVDVIFAFVNRTTDVVEKSVVRVDVTEEFPFLLQKISPYYEH